MSTKAYYTHEEIGKGKPGFSKTRSIIEAAFYGNNVVKSKFLTWKMERAQYLWNTHHCLRKSSMFVLSIFF